MHPISIAMCIIQSDIMSDTNALLWEYDSEDMPDECLLDESAEVALHTMQNTSCTKRHRLLLLTDIQKKLATELKIVLYSDNRRRHIPLLLHQRYCISMNCKYCVNSIP